MAVCPYCRSVLTLADFELGECPLCAGKLRADAPPRPAAAPLPDDNLPRPLASEKPQVDLPLEMTVMLSDSQGNKVTADDPRLDATIILGGGGTETGGQSLGELDPSKKTGDHRLAATVVLGGAAGEGPVDPSRKTDDLRIAATVDLDRSQLPGGELPPGGHDLFDAGAESQMSYCKRSFAASGPNLAIHPRVLADPKSGQHVNADYELQGLLGRGGMGVVLAARQASIDRTVALKKLHPTHAEDAESRRKFLTEAVVTGDLEHPNIVPIYDLGRDDDGLLFYAMKHVKGTPWNKVIAKKSLTENLEIYMKVADAVAFAHSRGVVHRDLKPENVMLGGYGEVLVMDWGLAIKTNTPAAAAAGVGGTPAYMGPEMMTSRPEEIGPASDIYLLGAILYEIVTGGPPHTGRTVQECLMAAMKNEIVPTKRNDELVTIARNAMATRPADRYASVSALQDAIRLYQSHSQSVLLSSRAEADLKAAEGREDYEFYARALLGFQEAYELWEGNEAAKEGIARTSLVYAERALNKENFDLAASLLDEAVPEQAPLLKKVRAAQREHNARRQRLKTFKRIGAALVATIFIVISGAFVWIRSEYQRAETAKNQAISSEKTAKEEKVKAEVAEKAAKASEMVAKDEKVKAESAEKVAKNEKVKAENAEAAAVRDKDTAVAAGKAEEAAKKKAIESMNAAEVAKKEALAAKDKEAYGAYIARIGLASAKIDENAFTMAESLLTKDCPEQFRNWEWGRLMHLCRQSDRSFDNLPERIETLSVSPDGKRIVIGGEGGTAQILDAASGAELVKLKTGGQYIFAAAFSPDGSKVALGTNDRPAYLQIFDAATGQKTWEYRSRKVQGEAARGHEDAILSVVWSRDGRKLLTGSYDNTARLWDLTKGEETQIFRGHDWWVWSAAFSPDERWIVTASQDGSAMVWDINDPRKPVATFRGHVGPVYAAVFSPNTAASGASGVQSLKPHLLVATAGYDKHILLWYPDALQDFDYKALLASEQADSHMTPESAGQRGILIGHTGAVKALCFAPDGRLLASGGNDNSVRIWNVDSRQIVKTLRGHGGRVRAVAFSPQGEGEGRRLFSAGHDETVKVWDLHRYEEMRVIEVAGRDGQRDAILGAAFSPTGDRIVTACRDRTARVWDRSGKLLAECKEGHEYLVSTAACFPDGKRLLTAAVDSTARIWNLASGGQTAVLKKTGPSAAAAVSHDGRWVLTGGDSESPRTANLAGHLTAANLAADEPLWPAKLWDASSGDLVRTLGVHRGEVTAVAFSPNDELLFTGDANGRGSLWNRATGELLCGEQKLHSRGITAAVFLPGSEGLLTAGADNTVVQWELIRGREGYQLVSRRLLQHPDAVSSLAVSPDGKRVCTSCSDKIVRLWNLASGQMAAAILADREQKLRIVDARAVADLMEWRNAQIASLRHQRRLAIADGAERKLTAEAIAAIAADYTRRERTILGREEINSVAFSPMGDLAATTATDGTVRLWDWNSGREIGSGERRGMPAFHSATGQAWSTVFSTNGEWLITVGGSDARLWDRESGRETMRFGPQGAVASARFSPDGRRIVTASWDDTARIWDAATGRVILKLQGHSEYVNDAVFSRDGTRVLTASDDKTARLWDAASGKELVVFRGHQQRIRTADLSCDPTTGAVLKVVTASDDGTARIWDPQGNLLYKLPGGGKAVLCAVFSADGSRVITGGDDNRAIVWDVQTGKQSLPLNGHTAGVTAVAFSSDGLRAVTGSRDNTVKIWELQTGKELLTLKGHNQEVTAVGFSSDKRSVLTGGLDGNWILWDAAPWRSH